MSSPTRSVMPTKYSYLSADGTRIDGYLFKPTGAGSFPAIVALHGCAGMFLRNGQLNPRELDWGRRLSENGYVVIYPDSFTSRGLKEICTRNDQPKMSRETRPLDALGSLNWLSQQDFVMKNHVAIMGWSNGGSSLLSAINKNLKVLPENIESDFKVAIAFYPGCDSSAKDENWESQVPIEILMGENDNWASPKPCEKLIAKSKIKIHSEITLYPHSYHDFDSPNLPMTTLKNLSYVTRPDHSALIGTNETSRQAAIKKVLSVLETFLKKQSSIEL